MTEAKPRQFGSLHWSPAAYSSAVLAQVRSGHLPENASASRYGRQWTCDQGYRESKGSCIAVEVPANAYPTDASYALGWRCNWGYRKSGGSCLAVKPPANAHLRSAQGDTWQCDRGFRMAGDGCVVIDVLPSSSSEGGRASLLCPILCLQFAAFVDQLVLLR